MIATIRLIIQAKFIIVEKIMLKLRIHYRSTHWKVVTVNLSGGQHMVEGAGRKRFALKTFREFTRPSRAVI